MVTIVNNNRLRVIYGYCVPDEEMKIEMALENIQNTIKSLRSQLSNLEKGLNEFINLHC